MIAIVDYGMGNLRSVEKGFQKVGVDARIVADAASVDSARGIVLPGVGAFMDCIKNLSDMKLTEAIIRSIRKGKPYLGICLGLQVLFTESEEFGVCRGLNVFKGKVVRFRFKKSEVRSQKLEVKTSNSELTTPNLKVPHMGWNTLEIKNKPPILDGVEDKSYFYFVHSFYVVPEDKNIIAGTTDYGSSFTSMVWKDNVFAMQFHPEKSQKLGLRILKGYGEFVRKG